MNELPTSPSKRFWVSCFGASEYTFSRQPLFCSFFVLRSTPAPWAHTTYRVSQLLNSLTNDQSRVVGAALLLADVDDALEASTSVCGCSMECSKVRKMVLLRLSCDEDEATIADDEAVDDYDKVVSGCATFTSPNKTSSTKSVTIHTLSYRMLIRSFSVF